MFVYIHRCKTIFAGPCRLSLDEIEEKTSSMSNRVKELKLILDKEDVAFRHQFSTFMEVSHNVTIHLFLFLSKFKVFEVNANELITSIISE